MPIKPRRRDEIAAAIAAHNTANRKPRLTPNATRLLTVMFADADICQRNLDSLALEGFNPRNLLLLLHYLTEAGFLTKQSGAGRTPNTYHLRLPPRVQP